MSLQNGPVGGNIILMFFWSQIAETNLSQWDYLLEEYQENLGETKRSTAKR